MFQLYRHCAIRYSEPKQSSPQLVLKIYNNPHAKTSKKDRSRPHGSRGQTHLYVWIIQEPAFL